jgi:hypothetical protein
MLQICRCIYDILQHLIYFLLLQWSISITWKTKDRIHAATIFLSFHPRKKKLFSKNVQPQGILGPHIKWCWFFPHLQILYDHHVVLSIVFKVITAKSNPFWL